MATTAKKRPAKKGGTKKGSAGAKTTAKTQDGPSKRELAAKRDEGLTENIVERRDNGESWADIASDLNITSGKAQFLMMKHRVAEGEVPAIKHRNETELVSGIRKARDAQNEFSSWGWISARSGVSEGKIKALAEEAGMDVSGSNVAVARAEKNGSGKKADTRTAKQAGRAKGGASKAAKAKARAKKAGRDPQ